MAERDEWRDFICSPFHAGRHLASIGSAVGSSIGDAIEIAELQAFLSRISAPQDVQVLADVIDLIRPEYINFIEKDLVRILDYLSNEMVNVEEIVGPALRGNPRWDRTILSRLGGALRPGKYLTRTAQRSFDLPENLLLRWLVEHLTTTIRDIGRRTGPEGLHPRLRLISARCEDALRHHWMADVPRTPTLTPQMLTRAERHRRGEYRRAAELVRTRNSLSSRDPDHRWHAILMLLAVGWLEPITDDDLFELYSLVLILDVMSDELGFGSPVEYGLLLRERRHVAMFEIDAGHIRVFFDQSPATVLGVQGRYTMIRDAHQGITGVERRPDMLVALDPMDKSHRPKRILVEVKRSTDGHYLSDSIYKAFGYLYDFEGLWNPSDDVRIILIVPEGVAPKQAKSMPEVLIVSAHDRGTLAAGLSQLLA